MAPLGRERLERLLRCDDRTDDIGGEYPEWIRRQDLSEADLPYVRDHLVRSFAEWREQTEGFPWRTDSPVVLLLTDGTAVAASEPAGGCPAPPGWSPDILGPNAYAVSADSCLPAWIRADEHRHPDLKDWDSLAVPVFTRTTGFPFAFVACLIRAGAATAADLKLLQAAALHYRTCFYQRFESLFVADLIRSEQARAREDRRRDTLFALVRRMQDHIEVEGVLAELFDSLEQLYPACRVDLFLSLDYSSTNEKVKPLAFHAEDMELCKQSFLLGQTRQERAGGRLRMALPLAGKQGVYGVLRLDAPEGRFDEEDNRIVSMLVGGAGTAFEKAKLHEQANALVGELRIINEITQRLNRSLRLSDTLQFATTELLQLFQADYCCFLQMDPGSEHFVVVSSNVSDLIGEYYPQNIGFCGVMWRTKEPVILSDYSSSTQVSSRLMDVTGSRSLLASPLMLNGQMIGAVLVSHREPNHFSYDNYKLLQVLSAHLGLAVSNASLHAEMRRMVITDNLTGLHARHYLDESIQRKQRSDSSGSLILVDIDHFKKVNDTYGHQIGDKILIQVSGIVRSSIRDTDIAARWGGEELAIYLPQLGLEQTHRVADRIRSRVEAETDPQVTVSCGIAEWKAGEEKVSVESLFYKADMALYEAKKNGRNRVSVG